MLHSLLILWEIVTGLVLVYSTALLYLRSQQYSTCLIHPFTKTLFFLLKCFISNIHTLENNFRISILPKDTLACRLEAGKARNQTTGRSRRFYMRGQRRGERSSQGASRSPCLPGDLPLPPPLVEDLLYHLSYPKKMMLTLVLLYKSVLQRQL